MYASLNDSYQWNQLNNNGALTNRVQDALAKGQIVGIDRMPTAFLQLKNRIKSPLTSQIMKCIETGLIKMVYTPDLKIPVYLPFVISQSSPNTFVGIVFLNTVEAETGKGEGDEIFVNARKLKVSLECCYMSLCIREMGNSPKLKSTTLLRSGSKIYSAMIAECINRKHAIKTEESVHNSILYLASRYYIGTMLGCRTTMEPEVMRNYCLYNCKNADVVEMDKIISQFTDEDFDNIATFISKLRSIPQLERRLGKLTVTNFMESFINMYNASALLSLEVFNYFLYNVMSVNDSTYINNYPVLKNIVGDDGKKIYADLVVATSNLH